MSAKIPGMEQGYHKLAYSLYPGWIICGVTFFSTVFHSHQDDGRVNMKGSAMKRHLGSERITPCYRCYHTQNFKTDATTCKISRLKEVSVAVQAGLSLTRSHFSEDRFSHDMAHYIFLTW